MNDDEDPSTDAAEGQPPPPPHDPPHEVHRTAAPSDWEHVTILMRRTLRQDATRHRLCFLCQNCLQSSSSTSCFQRRRSLDAPLDPQTGRTRWIVERFGGRTEPVPPTCSSGSPATRSRVLTAARTGTVGWSAFARWVRTTCVRSSVWLVGFRRAE